MPTALTQAPGYYRFTVPGGAELIALHDGVVQRDFPPGFVRNAPDAEVGAAYAQAGMPADKLTITFTPLAVRTPDRLALIDTGFGESGPPGTGTMLRNMAAAGLRPEDVTDVIISHMHGDHILGLTGKDGTARFPNAQIHVPAGDWAFWMDEGQASRAPASLQPNFNVAQSVFKPLAGHVRHYAYGQEIVPGLTSVDAAGHTPGMSAVQIGDAFLFVADITNNPLIFARHPEWQASFDVDPELATRTRRRLLDRAAADRLRLSFYHAPFPATGYIAKSGTAYEYLPALWAEG